MKMKTQMFSIGLVACAACLLTPVGTSQASTPTSTQAPNQAKTGPDSQQAPATTAPGLVNAPSAAAPATSPNPGAATPSTAVPSAAPGTAAPGSVAPGPIPSGAISPGPLNTGGAETTSPQAAAAAAGAPQAGRTVTLDEALKLALANEPTFAAAAAASKVAQLDRSIARAALLPSLDYHNQYLYTQANQAGAIVGYPQRFIANNAVHEYVSQGVVSETLGLAQYTALARADAAAAVASAELEISRRGLTSTVVSLFYSSSTAQIKLAILQRAADEAADFVKQTQQREALGEAAHADVIKAQLTMQQRQRDLADATLQVQKARLDLGVLLFADPRTPYTVELPATAPVPERAAVEAAASANNPELKSALATVREKGLGVGAARAAYLPSLVLNYTYGIDAPEFAATGREGNRNLGYSASATVDLPVWDWLATEHKVKQAQILHDAAKVALTAAQRRLIVQLDEFYAEAVLAHTQLDSLQQSARDARESLRLTRLRYSAGESTVLEVVDAQNTLTAAETALQDGTVRYEVALANLQLLTGKL